MENIKAHSSWNEFLTDDRKKQIKNIFESIGEDYTPEKDKILKFLENDLDLVKGVIIGLDPYPQKGAATGRCFEVGGLKSWLDSFRQASLRNIVRLIYKNYMEIEEYENVPTFNEIREKMKTGDFHILPPDQLFKSWEKQGVLLLNVYLTTKIGKPKAHKKLWEDFSTELFKYISRKNKNIYWMLWGKDAQSLSEYITGGKIVTANHPSRLNSKSPEDFLHSDTFKILMDKVDFTGMK